MPRFGITLLRDLTPVEREVLNDLVSALGGVLLSPAPVITEQPPLAPVVSGNFLDGDVPYGAVHIIWRNGIPVEAFWPGVRDRHTAVPVSFWQDVVQYAPQALWAPFAYIGYTESEYNEHANIMDTNDERSRGYFQINGVNRQYDNDSMLIGPNNVRAAVDIFNGQGFGAWFSSAKALGLI